MKRSTLQGPVLIVACVVALASVLVYLSLTAPSAVSSMSLPPAATTLNATLSVNSTGTTVSSLLFGVGIEADAALPTDSAALLSRTPIHVLRYPDGTAGDSMDLVNGTLYAPGVPGTSPALVSLPDFISLCRAINCTAIVQLPLEINDPVTAAFEVGYIENTLRFDPAYWELGNEPRNWTCYGVPWALWGNGCDVTVNASEYATTAGAYIAAVRLVDPSAQFVGLGGTNGPAWVEPLEREDGPELAGISAHSYVDDLLTNPGEVTVSNFFSGLTNPNSLPDLLVSSRKAIASACPACATTVFVTEMDSVSAGQPLSAYLDTSYNGLFFAAEVTQALNYRATSVEAFTWTGAESGLVNSSGPSWRYLVETSFLEQLGSVDENASVNASGMYAAATTSASTTTLMFVNTNTATAVNVSWDGTGISWAGSVSVWTWNASAHSTNIEENSVTAPTEVDVPPLSIVLVRGPPTTT
jgi:hypothetical protein